MLRRSEVWELEEVEVEEVSLCPALPVMHKLMHLPQGHLPCLFNGTKEGSARLLDENCGISTIDDTEGHIHDGSKTTIQENPWMVMISIKNDVSFDFACGGTLITKRLVLSAAHCILYEDTYLHLGDYLIIDPPPDPIKMYNLTVDMKFIHRDYKGSIVDKSRKFDIGMFRMKEEVTYSDYVRPICIPVDKKIIQAEKFNITGWGKTKQEPPAIRILHIGTVFPLNSSSCDIKYNITTDQSQICFASNFIGSCKGDSGGPLSSMHGNRTYQYGVVSFASDNCTTGSSIGVVTNVAHYMQWIENVIEVSETQYPGNSGFWHKISIIPL
ncbi:venom protease-like [Drosophila subpulchrella]|uniref:venom protease-like n=1 Tax=Drosophila subpulchrella TaxID=1486046 RepID=UPI0018A18A1F|nr:venom protease-like [Drosophila subpulchrella]